MVPLWEVSNYKHHQKKVSNLVYRHACLPVCQWLFVDEFISIRLSASVSVCQLFSLVLVSGEAVYR